MSFTPRGAVDLSSLAQPPVGQPVSDSADGASFVVEANELNFQEVIQASVNHLVVVCLWSPRSPQGSEYNDRVAAVVNSYGGSLQLALIDIDNNAQIAQAFGVQGVPTLVGIVKGQPVPLLQGTADETQLRQVFDELVTIAVQNGITGRAQPSAAGAATEGEVEAEPVDDPRFAAADEAFAAGDYDTAIAEYEKLRAQHPAEDEIAERLAGVKLMSRTSGADLSAARQAAADNPDDLEAQFLVADLDVSGGHIDDAFDRLIQLVKRSSGDDRETIRQRMIELFTVVGQGDPRVAKARRTLAAALY